MRSADIEARTMPGARLALGALAAAMLAAVASTAAAAPVTVPFVGCAEDGQVGPHPAPSGRPVAVAADAATAAKLAYYSAGDPSGVLAPRGWHCLGAYGSNGSVLYVTPGPIGSADVLADHWAAGAGPAVEAAWSSGDTSGRFVVAQAIERLFPAKRAFAQGVIAEGIEPGSDFPSGPFPTDRDTVRSATVVEYQTPAGAQGLGTTFSRLTPGAGAIDGVAVLQGATPNLAFLAARLTPDDQALLPAVLQAFEAEAAGPPAAARNRP